LICISIRIYSQLKARDINISPAGQEPDSVPLSSKIQDYLRAFSAMDPISGSDVRPAQSATNSLFKYVNFFPYLFDLHDWFH